jgi:hypothetical protein
MPKKPELSWEMKMAIWDLAAKQGERPEVILRDLGKLWPKGERKEELPDPRTVRKTISEFQSLPAAVLKTLPKHTWLLREDLEHIRVQLEDQAHTKPQVSAETATAKLEPKEKKPEAGQEAPSKGEVGQAHSSVQPAQPKRPGGFKIVGPAVRQQADVAISKRGKGSWLRRGVGLYVDISVLDRVVDEAEKLLQGFTPAVLEHFIRSGESLWVALERAAPEQVEEWRGRAWDYRKKVATICEADFLAELAKRMPGHSLVLRRQPEWLRAELARVRAALAPGTWDSLEAPVVENQGGRTWEAGNDETGRNRGGCTREAGEEKGGS